MGAPPLSVGSIARITLWLPGRVAVHLAARVVRLIAVSERECMVAVAFLDPSADAEDLLHEAVLECLERD